MKWRADKVAASLDRAPLDDSDEEDEFKYDKMYGFRSGATTKLLKSTPELEGDKKEKQCCKATVSSNKSSWDEMSIQIKLRVLDAFFDSKTPIGSNLPPIIKEQQAIYDTIFAKALAMPSEFADHPHSKAKRDAARASNKAAGDRISSAYKESMKRLIPDGHKIPPPHHVHPHPVADSRPAVAEPPRFFQGSRPVASEITGINGETRRGQFRFAPLRPNEGMGSEPRRRPEGAPPCPTREAPVVPRERERRFRRALTEPPKPATAYQW
ncbi:hypothetical protein ACHAQH_004903 [Verticillium albo-atrum]